MDENLKEIVKRIVEEIDPDRIMLFGSMAKGKNKNWSDYDICVLKKGIENKRKLARQIYRKLFGVGVSVDVIVETPEKFNKLKDKWFLVYSEIAKHGRVIYEK
ncbi:MAG TPA: nucleotidyltransferase domain-containing protein [Thermodesulfobacteriaceae bacterium]|nr:nucleotidyltransferase domain-containing protein [Thermodesulfobacteriaceae bacterium]